MRISLPPPPDATPAGAERRDTVRINLPARPPTSGPLRPPIKSVAPPAPSEPASPAERPAADPSPPFRAPFRPPTAAAPVAPPPSIVRATPMGANAAAAAAVVDVPAAPDPHPKKETARISILPDPIPASTPAAPSGPTVNMAKTQPLIKTPEDERPLATVNVSSAPGPTHFRLSEAIDEIPLPILWTLLGISALTFLIQLWNYLTV